VKHHWISAALALAALLGYLAPASAQSGGSPGGSRISGYPSSSQGSYNPSTRGGGSGTPWQGDTSPYSGQYGNQQGQWQGQPNQAGGQYGQWQGYSNQAGGQYGQSQGYPNQAGPSGQWGQYGAWQGGYGQNYDGYHHYGRGYHDGYHHGYQQGYGRQGADFANRNTRDGMDQGNRGNGFQRRRVSGEIQQAKKVQLPGIEDAMLVGVIAGDDGQTYLVNFGPASQLQKLDLKSGERISVNGEVYRGYHRPLLLAERVRYQGKRVPIEAFEDLEPQHEQIQGELTKLQKVQIPGMKGAMLVGLVKTKQGQQVIVNLGSSEQTGELDLEEGTQVRMQGEGFEVGEQRVLFANQVRANGRTLSLGD